VADSANDMDLGPVVAAASRDPAFLAGRISLAGAEQALAARLDIDQPRLQRLLLCRPPSPSRFVAEVHEIADLAGVDAGKLATGLREVDALGALRVGGEVHLGGTGMLAAAYDIHDDHVTTAPDRAEYVRTLAGRFWATAPERVRRERDVEAALAWSTRLTLVILSPLTLAAIRRWLAERGVPASGEAGDHASRGFLVAWRGVGVVFCDGAFGVAERRFTIAHELGHFILGYSEPRGRVMRDAPELLEVVDGIRSATSADRARAALARVPIGIHTHVFDDDVSAPSDLTVAGLAEDEASRFALELLAPWDETLAAAREVTAASAPYRKILERSAELMIGHFGIPLYAARARASQALDALGMHPGFFDR
jgi:hypothetical protein